MVRLADPGEFVSEVERQHAGLCRARRDRLCAGGRRDRQSASADQSSQQNRAGRHVKSLEHRYTLS